MADEAVGDANPGDETVADESAGDDSLGEERVGYGQPPKAHRFQKGQSGNPNGRPKRAVGPVTPFLDEMVTDEIGGRRRKMRRAAWFFEQLRRMSGDRRIARLLVEADGRIERAKRQHKIEIVTLVVPKPLDAIRSLGMACKLYPFARTARIVLAPWVVQMALDCWEGPELSAEQQQEVFKATRCPHQVRWPDWWLPEYRGKRRKRGARD